MPEVVPYLLLAVGVVGAWMGGLMALDVFTPGDVRALRRLSVLRGLRQADSLLERAAERSRVLQRIQAELDLQRLLALANRDMTPLQFIGRGVALALATFSLLLVIDAAGRAVIGDWPIEPWVVFMLAATVLPVGLLELRSAAHGTQAVAGRTLGDMMVLIAVMTDARGFQLDDAVRILSRCSIGGALRDLIDRRGFVRLVKPPYRSTAEQYRLIASAYQIPEMAQLADAAENANVGIPEREVYSRLALGIYRERLAQSRMRSARAKVLVTLPVAGMLIPLLLLIGAPTFAAISNGVR